MVLPLPTAGSSLLDALHEPDALSILFQPIVRLAHGRREIFAFECLTRGPAGTNAERADVLFEYVRQKEAERFFDRLCVAQAFRRAAAVAPFDISVNVHASTLSSDFAFTAHLIELARDSAVAPRNVIVEIVEHMPVLNARVFHRSLDALRAAGFRIALDDIGLGHSNFKMIVDCLPDFFKIDRYFVTRCGADARRMAVLEAVARLAERTGGRAVAEGVEDEETETELRALGIELLQGYLYATPMTSVEVREYIQLITHVEEQTS